MGFGLSTCCNCRCLRWSLDLERLGVTLTVAEPELRLNFDCQLDLDLADTDGRYAVYRGLRTTTKGPNHVTVPETVVHLLVVLDRLNRAAPRIVVQVTASITEPGSWDQIWTIPTTGGAIYTCGRNGFEPSWVTEPTLLGVFHERFDWRTETFVDQLWLRLSQSTVRVSVAPRSFGFGTSPEQGWAPQVTWCQRPAVLTVLDPVKISVEASFSGYTGYREPVNGRFVYGIQEAAVAGTPRIEDWPNSVFPTHRAYSLLARVGPAGGPGGVLGSFAEFQDLYTGGLFDAHAYSTARNGAFPLYRWLMQAVLYVPISASGTPWIVFLTLEQRSTIATATSYATLGTIQHRPHFDGKRVGSSAITYGLHLGGWRSATGDRNFDDMLGESLETDPLNGSGSVGERVPGEATDVEFIELP